MEENEKRKCMGVEEKGKWKGTGSGRDKKGRGQRIGSGRDGKKKRVVECKGRKRENGWGVV